MQAPAPTGMDGVLRARRDGSTRDRLKRRNVGDGARVSSLGGALLREARRQEPRNRGAGKSNPARPLHGGAVLSLGWSHVFPLWIVLKVGILTSRPPSVPLTSAFSAPFFGGSERFNV